LIHPFFSWWGSIQSLDSTLDALLLWLPYKALLPATPPGREGNAELDGRPPVAGQQWVRLFSIISILDWSLIALMDNAATKLPRLIFWFSNI
jgi:hypothetical protein